MHSLGINCGDKANVSCCGSGCPNAHAVSLLILEYPRARREITIAAINCNDASQFSDSHSVVVWMCAGSVWWFWWFTWSDLTHLVDWRHWVYAAQLVMVSAFFQGAQLVWKPRSQNGKMLLALMAVMMHKWHSSSGCNFKRLFRGSESLHCSS